MVLLRLAGRRGLSPVRPSPTVCDTDGNEASVTQPTGKIGVCNQLRELWRKTFCQALCLDDEETELDSSKNYPLLPHIGGDLMRNIRRTQTSNRTTSMFLHKLYGPSQVPLWETGKVRLSRDLLKTLRFSTRHSSVGTLRYTCVIPQPLKRTGPPLHMGGSLLTLEDLASSGDQMSREKGEAQVSGVPLFFQTHLSNVLRLVSQDTLVFLFRY